MMCWEITHLMVFINRKISIELNNILSQEGIFQGENRCKVISSCESFMQKVFEFSQRCPDGWARIHSRACYNDFRKYKIKYTEVFEILERHGIMFPRKIGYLDMKTGERIISRFRLTDFGVNLLFDPNKEYIRKQNNDPKEDKRIRNRKSKRNSRIKELEDQVISKTLRNILDLRIDESAFDNYWKNNKQYFSPKQIYTIELYKDLIKNGQFKKLRRCIKDARIHHPWVCMPSLLRPFFLLRGKKYLRTIDIRSCHPTFWAKYICEISRIPEYLSLNEDIKDLLKTKYKEYNNILTNNSIYTNSIYHSLIYNSSIPPSPVSQHYVSQNVTLLIEEYIKWTEFWTNPDVDPKQQIIKDLGGTYSRDEIKELINASINSKKNAVFNWIQNHYPALFAIWNKIELKKTGNNISRFYETKLMLDPELIRLAESMGLDVLTEHDGHGIFSDENDSELDGKVGKLRDWVQEKSVALFGLKVQIKIDKPEDPPVGRVAIEERNRIKRHTPSESKAKNRRKPIQNKIRPRNEAPF
jgi:hypothetical protein